MTFPPTLAGRPVLPDPLTRDEACRLRPYTGRNGIKFVTTYRRHKDGIETAEAVPIEDQNSYAPATQAWMELDRLVVVEARKVLVDRTHTPVPVLRDGKVVIAMVPV